MEKGKPFGEQKPFDKNVKGPQPKNRDDRSRPGAQPEGPGERSDEESIGRPVQLDHVPPKPRRPAEEENRPRTEHPGA
jgi:hypothetical protein